MEWILSAFSYILPFTLLLGVLVFIHELGHFLVARACKVRVEVFSLGFGKKILSYKKGDTCYCVSIIPLGGYVKMFGDDPTKEVPEEERKHSFLCKSLPQKTAIVLAGPLMNLFFAMLAFTLINYIGETHAPSVVGDIKKGSSAYLAGFRSGDRILSIDGEKTQTWTQVNKKIEDSAETWLNFQVISETSHEKNLRIKPKTSHEINPMRTSSTSGVIEGLSPFSEAPILGVISPESIAYKNGFTPFSQILSINGEQVKFFRQVEALLKRSSGKPLVLEIEDEKSVKKQVSISQWQKIKGKTHIRSLGLASSQFFIGHIKHSSAAEKQGLKNRDFISEMNRKPLGSWDELLNMMKKYKSENGTIHLKISRDGKVMEKEILPEVTQFLKPNGVEETRYLLGISPLSYSKTAETVIFRYESFLESSWKGIKDSFVWSWSILVNIYRLITTDVSYKTVGGVLSIGKYAGETYNLGWIAFLKLMAIISLNLFLINLFPIPVLDGGHLLLFALEAIKGSALDMKVIAVAQYSGFFLLISLLGLTIFNDIFNIFLN